MAINITAPTKTKDGYISNWFACNNPVVFAFETTSSDNFIQIALYETDGISQIVELKRVPFPNNNIIKFDFQSFLQSVTSNEDDSLLINTGVGVNAVSQYKTFRIGYRTTETGAYTVDINEYNAINSVRQALSPYGQNMVDYLYNIDYSGPTLDFSGRFLTEFKELPLYWFSPFDNPSASEVTYFYPTLAFIITEEFADNSTGYKVVSDFKNSDGSIAKTITQNNVFSSPYSQRVVYINYESVSPDEAFFYDSIDITIQDLDNNFDIISTYVLRPTRVCLNPTVIKWKNDLGGWDVWAFEGSAPFTIETEVTGNYEVTYEDIQNLSEISKQFQKRRQPTQEVSADNLDLNQAKSLSKILSSPTVRLCVSDFKNGESAEAWQTVNVFDGDFTIYDERLKKYSFSFGYSLLQQFTISN